MRRQEILKSYLSAALDSVQHDLLFHVAQLEKRAPELQDKLEAVKKSREELQQQLQDMLSSL